MDFVARYGGEEFVIVLCDTDTAGAVLVGQTLLNSVRQLAIETAPDTPISVVSISIGMASCYPRRNRGSEFLINLADQQLYKAKRVVGTELHVLPSIQSPRLACLNQTTRVV